MAPNAGLQLFPPPPKKRDARRPSAMATTDAAKQPVAREEANPEINVFAEGPEARAAPGSGSSHPGPSCSTPTPGPSALRSSPDITPVLGELPRSQTSFSDATTLVRSHSAASRSSIAKVPPGPSSPVREPPMIRSIFPRYNPDVPLEQQQYYPTQASPTHIPRAVINRQSYAPNVAEAAPAPLRSPMSIGSNAGRFTPGIQEPPKLEPCTSDELKDLWKVTHGWKASPSEGQVFRLKMASSPDAPIHTLSSDTQPFYTIQLDPTSTSALVTMTRQDPSIKNKRASSKPFEIPRSGQEVLTTTLEEPSRRLPPNDGLVALLYPRAASNMVIELAAKAHRQGVEDPSAVVAAAELECGRLVWDDDTKCYYLVHPAAATPFRIQIAASPAWSRVEYVLEHPELPDSMVKLTRDGAGGGVLQVDTGMAARINSVYIVDVAVCAVLIVAISEEKAAHIEHFQPPPPSFSAPGTPQTNKDFRRELKKKNVPVAEMEIDLESQDSLKKAKQSLPVPARGLLGCVVMALKFVVWILTALARLIIWACDKLAKRTGGDEK